MKGPSEYASKLDYQFDGIMVNINEGYEKSTDEAKDAAKRLHKIVTIVNDENYAMWNRHHLPTDKKYVKYEDRNSEYKGADCSVFFEDQTLILSFTNNQVSLDL